MKIRRGVFSSLAIVGLLVLNLALAGSAFAEPEFPNNGTCAVGTGPGWPAPSAVCFCGLQNGTANCNVTLGNCAFDNEHFCKPGTP